MLRKVYVRVLLVVRSQRVVDEVVRTFVVVHDRLCDGCFDVLTFSVSFSPHLAAQ